MHLYLFNVSSRTKHMAFKKLATCESPLRQLHPEIIPEERTKKVTLIEPSYPQKLAHKISSVNVLVFLSYKNIEEFLRSSGYFKGKINESLALSNDLSISRPT